MHVEVGNETITTTKNHPFWVDGHGFKEAGLLEVGDLVETTEGELLPITAVEIEYLDEPVNVYNFEVEDWHTYYVSDSGVWVHNTKCSESGSSSKIRVDSYDNMRNDPNVTGQAHHLSQNAVFKNAIP